MLFYSHKILIWFCETDFFYLKMNFLFSMFFFPLSKFYSKSQWNCRRIFFKWIDLLKCLVRVYKIGTEILGRLVYITDIFWIVQKKNQNEIPFFKKNVLESAILFRMKKKSLYLFTNNFWLNYRKQKNRRKKNSTKIDGVSFKIILGTAI